MVAGESVTIPVTVTGIPEPTVQFLKNDKVLSSTVDRRFTLADHQLTIRDVNMEDRGDYSIIASNIVGTDTHSRRLIVKCKFF